MEENKEVFCSYDSQDKSNLPDKSLLAELKTHLQPSLQQRAASLWEEWDIPYGTEEPERVINKHLNTAPLILLLVSPSYLSSKDCRDQVLQAMERNKEGNARVIPIILKPCVWKGQPFSKLPILPTGARDRKAVTSWPDRNAVWSDIVGRIVDTLDDMGIKPVTEQPPSAISRQQPVDEQLRILSDTVQPSLVVQKHVAEKEVPKKGRPAQPREEGKIAKIFITFLSIVVICALIITLFVLASAKKEIHNRQRLFLLIQLLSRRLPLCL